MTPPMEGVQGKEWFLFAEDSAKLFQTASIAQMQQRLGMYDAADKVEIIQVGYRRTTGKQEMKLLNLDTMEVIQKDKRRKVTKIVGQKVFMATRKGIALLKRRLPCATRTSLMCRCASSSEQG